MSIELINNAIDACKKDNVQELNNLITKFEDKEVTDVRGCSLLNISLKQGSWKSAQLLIDKGFSKCSIEFPAIISACQCKKDDVAGIRILADSGFDLGEKNTKNRTALMTCCLMGHKNKAQELFQYGAEIDEIDEFGNNALHEGVLSNKSDLVRLILEHSPNAKHINNEGQNALMISVAQKKPSEDIVKQLLEFGFDPELDDKNKKSAWHVATQKHPKIQRIISNHLNTVNQIELPIFSSGAENLIEETDAESTTDIEVEIENPELPVQEAKEQEIDVMNEIINTSNEPIIEQDNIDAMSQNTIKPNNQSSNADHNLWFSAAKKGNLGQLNRLIIDGIDINCKDAQGCTALIRASGNKRRAVVSFLLQQNAEIETRSDNGSTALSSSIIGNSRRVAGLLLDNGANPNGYGPSNYSYVTIAAAQWNEAMLSILHRFKADLNVFNSSNQNLAHVASLGGAFHQEKITSAKSTFTFFSDHGIDLNHQDIDGNTPFLILCGVNESEYEIEERNLAAILHFLIKLGASAVITNKQGVSPLDVVRKHKLQQCKGVIMNALSWNDNPPAEH